MPCLSLAAPGVSTDVLVCVVHETDIQSHGHGWACQGSLVVGS